MLEADTEAGTYWKKCGDEALQHGVKGIVIMVSKWELTSLRALPF